MKLAFLFCQTRIALILFVFVSSCWGWADERPPESLLHQWAESSEWLHLLHMQKSRGGYSSSVQTFADQPSFFLSSQGATDPFGELKATYTEMFEQGAGTAQKTQCRFLARRDFFVRHFKGDLKGALVPCSFSEEWMKKLNTTKVSLIFAAGYMNSAASSFGHTFLKLQNPENQSGKALLDYGINFAARTSDSTGALYALYGLMGYFPGTFGMAPYHQMIKEYTNLEGRDLWEYELDLSAEEISRMLWHLLELEGAYFDYYFLDDNCSFEILKLLEIARPYLDLAKEDELFVIPLDTVKRAERLFVRRTFRPSLQTQWQQQLSHLNSEQKKQIRSMEKLEQWSTETLSAGQLYYSLKAYSDFEKYKTINYQLSRERAQRGKVSATVSEEIPAQDPMDSHHSAMIQAGVFQRQNELRFLSGFHFAFHDELSRNSGLPPFSHLEVGGLQFEKTQLRRYRLLEMLSTQAINSFDQPVSWGVASGGDLWPTSQDHLQNFIEGKVGWSFDLHAQRWRWSQFLVLGAKQDEEDRVQMVPGLESRFWILWSEGVRTLAQIRGERYPHQSWLSWRVDQAVDITRQLELRVGVRAGKIEETSFWESQVFLQQNF